MTQQRKLEIAMILLMKKRVFAGSLVFCLLMLLVYSGYVFCEVRQSVLSEICNLCDKVIHRDKEYRLKEINTLSFSGYKMSDCDSSTISYSSGHVEKIAKNANTVDLIAEEKQYRVDQSYLLMENPVNIVVLDSLFNLALLQSNMVNVRTAMVYTVNSDTARYSNPDSDFYRSSIALPPITTGIKDEIVLQAYVDIPFSYVVAKDKEHFIILLIIFCLILGVLFAIWYSKKILVPIQEKPRELLKIKENLLFDRERGLFYIDGDTQVSLKNIQLKLFLLLLDSPEHFQTSEEIKRIVWGKTGATTDTLNTTIRRLRVSLEPISDLKIVFGNAGYRLDIL